MAVLLSQKNWRLRNDDGSESAATWKAAVNTSANVTKGQNFRLRAEFKEPKDGELVTGVTTAIRIQARINGGAWFSLSGAGSTDVHVVTSTHLTHHADTTQQIGSGTYLTDNDGQVESSNQSGSKYYEDRRAEIEWCLQIKTSVSNGATIEFRFEQVLTGEIIGLGSGNTTPTLTAVAGTQTISPTGIASVSAVGQPTVANLLKIVNPAGIASAEAFGSPTVEGGSFLQTINPAGIAAPGGVGSPTVIGGSGSVFEVDVGDSFGSLESVSAAQLEAGMNWALVGEEIVGFRSASIVSPGVYSLSNLSRKARETSGEGHSNGERFVLLTDEVQRVTVGRTSIGKTVLVKCVSKHQNPDDVTPIEVVIAEPTPPEWLALVGAVGNSLHVIEPIAIIEDFEDVQDWTTYDLSVYLPGEATIVRLACRHSVGTNDGWRGYAEARAAFGYAPTPIAFGRSGSGDTTGGLTTSDVPLSNASIDIRVFELTGKTKAFSTDSAFYPGLTVFIVGYWT